MPTRVIGEYSASVVLATPKSAILIVRESALSNKLSGFRSRCSLAFTAGQFWIVIQNYLRTRRGQLPLQKIADVNEIAIGGAVSFAYPDAHDSCLLLRTGESTFIAFSQKCTHLSCAVVPQMDKGRFQCPCHEGSFDLTTGEPVAGPPRRPLPKITIQVRNGAVYAAGIELRTI